MSDYSLSRSKISNSLQNNSRHFTMSAFSVMMHDVFLCYSDTVCDVSLQCISDESIS
jgi:hypothetical protein